MIELALLEDCNTWVGRLQLGSRLDTSNEAGSSCLLRYRHWQTLSPGSQICAKAPHGVKYGQRGRKRLLPVSIEASGQPAELHYAMEVTGLRPVSNLERKDTRLMIELAPLEHLDGWNGRLQLAWGLDASSETCCNIWRR